jgi:hypothetical protein
VARSCLAIWELDEKNALGDLGSRSHDRRLMFFSTTSAAILSSLADPLLLLLLA